MDWEFPHTDYWANVFFWAGILCIAISLLMLFSRLAFKTTDALALAMALFIGGFIVIGISYWLEHRQAER